MGDHIGSPLRRAMSPETRNLKPAHSAQSKTGVRLQVWGLRWVIEVFMRRGHSLGRGSINPSTGGS